MKKTLYHVETGMLLGEGDQDYHAYSIVYDKKHGYFDTDQFETFDLELAKTYYAEEMLPENFYIIITNVGLFDDEEIITDENGIIADFDPNDCPVPNALT